MAMLLRPLALCCAATAAAALLDVARDGSVRVDGALWLAAAPPRLWCDGQWHPLSDEVLSTATSGSDELGPFVSQTRSFAGVAATVSVKAYGEGMFVLEQALPQGCSKIQASTPNITRGESDYINWGSAVPFLSFPAWRADGGKLPELRYLTWQGGNHRTYQWTVQESHGVNITQPKPDGTFGGLAGLSSGPVVLIANNSTSPADVEAVAIGPLSTFKLATSLISQRNDSTGAVWEMGVSSEVRSVPAGFVHRTLIVGADGPTRAMQRWGSVAQRLHNTTRRSATDPAVNTLSYFTDNGAMFYGDAWQHEITTCCNESLFLEANAALQRESIPVHFWQLDDWWYPGYMIPGAKAATLVSISL
jgi:hypothetical protein